MGSGTLFSIFDRDLNNSVILVTVTAVALGASLLIGRSRAKKKKNNNNNKYAVPWPKVEGALPIIGNFHELRDPKYLADKTHEWADKYSKETGVFEMALMGVRWIVVCNEERMEELMAHRPFKVIRSKKATGAARSTSADGVFAKEGDLWKRDRKLVAPMFNKNHVRDYLTHVKTVTERLLGKWSKNVGEPFAINKDILAYALDFTALVVLGKEFDSLNQHNRDAADMCRTFSGATARALSPVPYWEIPVVGQYLDGLGFGIKRLDNSLSRIIDEHKDEGVVSAGDGSLVDKAVKQSQRDASFDRQQIIGNLMTALFAGTDSSAATLCSAIQYLIEDTTGLQQELYEETVSKLPANLDEVTLEHLREGVPRLSSFLFEVLRMSPAFPVLFLESADDVEFCGANIPKGTGFITLMQYSSINPYSAPENLPKGPKGSDNTKFCPRRYLIIDEDGSVSVELPDNKNISFLPFGYGHRQCIGKSFAEVSLAITLATLLRSFKFDKPKDYESAGRILLLASSPDKDIRVVLTPR